MEERQGCILAIGSAYGENVLQLDSKLVPGQKHNVVCHELLGGSGINYTLRLINAGVPTFPILPIGNDKLGYRIRDEIIASAKKMGLPDQIIRFINSEDFFIPNLTTPRSFNVVEKETRTSFVEQVQGYEKFNDFIKQRLDYLDGQKDSIIDTVMIGHINSDSPNINPNNPGESTRYLIQRFHDKSLVFGNFGNSQICMGADFWDHDLRQLSILQLNLHEIRSLLAQNVERKSLSCILEWLMERSITAVITLDKFGAICSYKGGEDGIILAWPYEAVESIDTTGAGDAFGTGLISALSNKTNFSFEDFYEAIGTAGLWAAYACTTLGGASNCPNKSRLERYKNEIMPQDLPYIEIQEMENVKRILQLLDRAY